MEDLKRKIKIEERYERKFAILDLPLKQIEEIVKHNPFMFSEIFYERQINNIYLDFDDMGNYMENVIGSAQRLKIRIRWYGKLSGKIQNPVLELKIKNGETFKKLSFPLKAFVFNMSFSKEFLKEVLAQSTLPHWLSETVKLTHPSLLNCYKRRYFLSQNKKYRATLDYNLAFVEIRDRKNSFKSILRDRRNIILEIKYNCKDDEDAQKMTQFFPFRMTRNSKYIFGVNYCMNS